MNYPYDAYLNESILDTLTPDDNTQQSSPKRLASSSNDEIARPVRITFSFYMEKYNLKDIEPYEKLFESICNQFKNSRFIKSFRVWNVSWDASETKDRTFNVENHSADADKDYSKFLDDSYRRAMESFNDNMSIINRFDIEPIEKQYPFRKFCREIDQWFRIIVRGYRGLYENLNVLVTRTDRTDLFAVMFKGSTQSLNQRDVESAYRKIWPEASNRPLISDTVFNEKFSRKELFEFRSFLKYLHGRPNIFPGAEIYVRGDGTWKSTKPNGSYSDLESWNIYLKINSFKNPEMRNTNASIEFVKQNIYSHFGPGDRYMLMSQVKSNHVGHMTMKFYICIPTEWKDSEDSTMFFDQVLIDIPKKMQHYNGPEKIPVEFIIECVDPDVYGAEVVVDEDGNWTNEHITWSKLATVLNQFMASESRYTPLS